MLGRRCATSSPQRGYVEVDTPALQVSPGLEPHLQAFATVLHDPRDGGARPRYLHTSPEFAMKKLLAGGHAADLAAGACLPRRRAQRDASPGILDARMVSRRRLLPRPDGRLRGAAARACQEAAGAEALRWRGRSRRRRGCRGERLSVAEAFAAILRHRSAGDRARPAAARSRRCSPPRRARIGIAPHPDDDWETLFFRIFLERIEPHLGIGAPTILYDYPLSMAALSRRKPGRPAPRRALRALCLRPRARQRLRRADRSGRAARAASPPTRRKSRRSTARPIRSTRISSRRSNTACRIAPGSRSASTGWSCWPTGADAYRGGAVGAGRHERAARQR